MNPDSKRAFARNKEKTFRTLSISLIHSLSLIFWKICKGLTQEEMLPLFLLMILKPSLTGSSMAAQLFQVYAVGQYSCHLYFK